MEEYARTKAEQLRGAAHVAALSLLHAGASGAILTVYATEEVVRAWGEIDGVRLSEQVVLFEGKATLIVAARDMMPGRISVTAQAARPATEEDVQRLGGARLPRPSSFLDIESDAAIERMGKKP